MTGNQCGGTGGDEHQSSLQLDQNLTSILLFSEALRGKKKKKKGINGWSL